MNDIEMLFLEGKIDAATYTKLMTQQQTSGLSEDAINVGKAYGQSIKENLGTDPSLIPASGVEYQMSMSPEELETYTSRGITPSTFRDYEDDRAERQSISDKWGNGITKLLGKSATATVGGVGMLGSALYNVAGQIEDLWTDDNTSFHEIYNNDFYRALDNANKAMDEALPHYVTREEENYSALKRMGTANFWSNDFAIDTIK